MAIITTLSADFDVVTFYGAEELMGAKDILDWGKALVTATLSPVTSLAKGIGHAGMEIGRGVSRGDIGRVLLAPVKGVGHVPASYFRDAKDYLSYYYRPSRMGWMKQVGPIVSAIGAIPGPHSIFMIPLGLGMATAGAVGDGIFQQEKAKQALEQGEIDAKEAENLKKENTKQMLKWIALIGAGGLIANEVL